jgi:hypothetical protein
VPRNALPVIKETTANARGPGALAVARKSIQKWYLQLHATKEPPEGSTKVTNALATVGSDDLDLAQFPAIRLPVTLDTGRPIAAHTADEVHWRALPKLHCIILLTIACARVKSNSLRKRSNSCQL